MGMTLEDSKTGQMVLGISAFLGYFCLGLLSDLIYTRHLILSAGVLVGTAMIHVLIYESHLTLGAMATIVFLLGFFLAGSSVIVTSLECDIGKAATIEDGV